MMDPHRRREPSPIRDSGPYQSHAQARDQYAAVVYGVPTDTSDGLVAASSMVLTEALLLAQIETSTFEQAERDAMARQLDPHTIQVIAGWVIRARLAADSAPQ